MFCMCYYIIYYEDKEQKNILNTLKLRFFLLKNSKHILGKQKTRETKGRKSNCCWNPTVICGYSKRMITFTDNEGIEVKDHTSYYRSQLAGTLDRIREKGKELIILKQVPMFDGAKDCDWEPRIKKLLGKERICNFDTAFINKWQQPSIDFIDEFAATYNVAVFDPVPFFNGPLHYGINLYRDSDHLNIYGKQFLVPHFVKVMDEIMADKKEKNMADTALLSANKPR